jgi:hypothetical protein
VRLGHETSMHYFHARVAWCVFPKEGTRTRFTEHVFLHPVLSMGYVVHSSASRARNVSYYFSCSGGTSVVSIKSVIAHFTPNLCFYILWHLRGQVLHSGASTVRNIDELFFILRWELVLRRTCVSLHPVRSVGHGVHSGASGA